MPMNKRKQPVKKYDEDQRKERGKKKAYFHWADEFHTNYLDIK